MKNFILGLIVGVFLIPIIKEVGWRVHMGDVKDIFKRPIEFTKDVVVKTFIGGF